MAQTAVGGGRVPSFATMVTWILPQPQITGGQKEVSQWAQVLRYDPEFNQSHTKESGNENTE